MKVQGSWPHRESEEERVQMADGSKGGQVGGHEVREPGPPRSQESWILF